MASKTTTKHVVVTVAVAAATVLVLKRTGTIK